MKVIDLTLTLSPDMIVWENDRPVQIETAMRLEDGDDFTLSNLSLSVHAGTHVDAPSHYLAGQPGVDRLSLECLTGPAWIADCRGEPVISETVLSRLEMPPDIRRIFFLTDNTAADILHEGRFTRDFVALDASAARWLTAKGFCMAGIDALSIAPYDSPGPTHRILLEAGVIIVEALDMTRIAPGHCEICVLPLKIRGADGAPARVIAKQIQ